MHTDPAARRSALLALAVLAVALLGWALDAGAQLRRGGRFDKGGGCLECHEDVGQGLRVAHSPLKEGECTACHKPHGLVGALRLQKDEPDLCLDCHDEAAMHLENTTVHPGVADRCSLCHDPHGSNHGAILKTAERELCLECHEEAGKAGAVPHPPAAEGCSSCHLPHSSVEKALLRQPVAEGCALCHEGQAAGYAASHNGLSVAGSDCTACHPPHSGASEHLLRASVHSEISCDLCHEGELAVAPAGGSDLCLECHEAPQSGGPGRSIPRRRPGTVSIATTPTPRITRCCSVPQSASSAPPATRR